MQPTNKQKQEIIRRIRTSETFKKATTSNAILQYLHEATLRGEDLNENTISIDFFGRKEYEEKNNTKVRVSIYNLRKKLDDYYKSEGKKDIFYVKIEKGQYKLLFVPHLSYHRFRNINWKAIVPYPALLICLFLLVFTNKIPRTPKIWQDFISKNTPTEVYVGDLFGMVGTTITGSFGVTRDYHINNHSQYYQLIKEQPELQSKLKPAAFNLTPGMSILSAQRLQQFFLERHCQTNINFLSLTSTTEIKESDAVYFGAINANNKFISFFNKANSNYQIKKRNLIYINEQGQEESIINFNESNEVQEYALVSKYKASESADHFVFFSQNEIGVLATIEYFTNTDSIKSFSKRYLKEDSYFTAIFKVQGQERTATDLSVESVITF